jgi:ABC-type glycerol-3-phosphate transport system substrate-binding protein
MKKFLAIAAIAGTLVACGNNADNSTAADSSAVTVDTSTITVDTTGAMSDTGAALTADTTTTAGADTSAAQ